MRKCNVVRFFSRYPHKFVYKMNKVYFKHVTGEDQCQITFKYCNPVFGIDRTFNFSRSINEKLEASVDRIKSNIEKEFNKKNKKKNKKAAVTDQPASNIPDVTVKFLDENNEEIKNCEFSKILELCKICSKTSMKIAEESFEILLNSPWVNAVILPSSILAGFYVYPSKLELQFADKESSAYKWFRGKWPESNDENTVEWEEIGTNFAYLVKNEDTGYRLKLSVEPKNCEKFGPIAEAISNCNVEASPGMCPFEIRNKFTEKRLSGNKFRVVTYNLLADLYADSDYTRAVLFPYCPAYALNIDYRKQLFIKEILGYRSDLICLQEVDTKIFDLDLQPILKYKHYQGSFQEKGKSGEGLAIFYDTRRFQCIDQRGINIGENVKKLSIFRSIWEKVKVNEKLIERLTNRSTSVQIIVLQSKDNPQNHLLVANTHLYFHPDADHVRLLQMGLSMLYVQDIYEELKKTKDLNDSNISIIFCGDFNSVPECGIYKLMIEKFVPEDFIDWKSNQEEAVKNVNLIQPFNFESAVGCPTYTNFTHAFAACLDYIYFQTDNLKIDEVVPMPSEDELRLYTAIPSPVFPSDHCALVASLEWKS